MTNEDSLKTRQKELILTSLGVLKKYFQIPEVTNIWVDTEGRISIKEFGQPRKFTGENISTQSVKNILVQIARYMEQTINFSEYPVLEGTIPEFNARITGVFPRWSKAPFLTIRKPSERIITLEEYVEKKQLSKKHYDVICDYCSKEKSILVAGGVNSGKTTLTKAILNKMIEFNPSQTIFIVEDNAEIKCNSDFVENILIDSGKKNEAYLALKLAMRMSPNRIVFGEIRQGDVLYSLLTAWSSGHPGISTIHSDSALGTFTKMKELLMIEFKFAPMVNNLIDLIVYIKQDSKTGVKIEEIIKPKNYTDMQIQQLLDTEHSD